MTRVQSINPPLTNEGEEALIGCRGPVTGEGLGARHHRHLRSKDSGPRPPAWVMVFCSQLRALLTSIGCRLGVYVLVFPGLLFQKQL